MSGYQKYVQRLERCEALQFTEVGQAPEIALLLGCYSWNLQYSNPYKFSLALAGKEGEPVWHVERGDYVVVRNRDDTSLNYWMSRREFEQNFEEQP